MPRLEVTHRLASSTNHFALDLSYLDSSDSPNNDFGIPLHDEFGELVVEVTRHDIEYDKGYRLSVSFLEKHPKHASLLITAFTLAKIANPFEGYLIEPIQDSEIYQQAIFDFKNGKFQENLKKHSRGLDIEFNLDQIERALAELYRHHSRLHLYDDDNFLNNVNLRVYRNLPGLYEDLKKINEEIDRFDRNPLRWLLKFSRHRDAMERDKYRILTSIKSLNEINSEYREQFLRIKSRPPLLDENASHPILDTSDNDLERLANIENIIKNWWDSKNKYD